MTADAGNVRSDSDARVARGGDAMLRGKTDADTCRLNGWTVGTQLEGDEGYGPTVIQITAIGERSILARAMSHNGKPRSWPENNWTLTCREWRKVGQVAVADGELAEMRAEVERLRRRSRDLYEDATAMAERAEAAEAVLRAVEALADEWERHSRILLRVGMGVSTITHVDAVRRLRAVLDSHPTGTPEAGEGRG